MEEWFGGDEVCKLKGHVYSAMFKHYDRMKMRNLIPEVNNWTLGRSFKQIPYADAFVTCKLDYTI